MAKARPPLACVMDAIPEGERASHMALAADLFGRRVQARRDLPRGYVFRFASDALADVARFLANERRCCPFLAFALRIEPGDGPVWLRITGPAGTRAFLAEELPGFG